MIARTQLYILMITLTALSGCAPQKFVPVADSSSIGLSAPQNDDLSSNFYKLSDSQNTFQQDQLDQNKTALSFHVQLADGTYVNDLQASDLQITENGVAVTPFQLSSNSQNIVQTVDIVFAVDITASMAPTIESAKTRLINFVTASRQQGYHTRMCLVTFGDYTVQNCNQFYDNDPADPATQSQVDALISDISKLRAYKGAEDPGGSDKNENPMRALIDGSKAPWGVNSQRFMILITDDGFLYSPGNQGAVGTLAPAYTEVTAALTASQMQVFAVTPSLPGYDQNFNGATGIVDASQGEFFLFADLVSGKISLDSILSKIISHAKTTYLAEYTSDAVTGLDPSLPLAQRHIQVTLKNGKTGTLTVLSQQSNLPDGRPQYAKVFKLDGKSMKSGTLQVLVNGTAITTGFQVMNGVIVFDQAPSAGAKIQVNYAYDSLKDSLQFTPVVLDKSIDLNSIEILFNGVRTKGPDVTFERTLEGQWSIRPSDSALSESDPFGIRNAGGLLIRVVQAK